MEDGRLAYLVSASKALLGNAGSALDRMGDHDDVERFLNDPSCRVLQAIVAPPGNAGADGTGADGGGAHADSLGGLICSSQIQVPGPGSKEVHFIKLRAEPLTEANVSSLVQASSLKQSPLQSLYHSVHTIFAPMLRQSNDGSIDRAIVRLVEELDQGLSSAVSRGERF